MAVVCDFDTMFADAARRNPKNGPVQITTANDATETFHFQAGGRKSNQQAVLVLNVRDNSEGATVLINDRSIGQIERSFGVDDRTWQTQSIVFPESILGGSNRLRFEVRSGDIEIKDMVLWFHQDA